MKQVKIFNIPEEVAQANDFMAVNPPESVATVSKGEQCFIFVNYDDYTYPAGYKIAEMRELMLSNEKETMTSKISKGVMELDLAKYTERLAKEESILADINAEKAPADLKKKELYDWEKTQGEKVQKQKQVVEDINNSIANIKGAMDKLDDSIIRFALKNVVMQKAIDELSK